MDVGLLFSGGKDSSLAALLLERFYDVTLVTVHFGIGEDWRHAQETAEALGFPFEDLRLVRTVAEEAVDRIVADGYPRHGIQRVHESAMEALAQEAYGGIADGTRRDDRVPTVPRALAQRLEDRHGVRHISPLAGFGRAAVDELADRDLEVEVGPSATLDRADYEAELRALLAQRAGEGAVEEIFPAHEQTVVHGRVRAR